MPRSACSSWCPCNLVFVVILLCFLGGSLLTGALALGQEIVGTVSLPRAAWLPLSAVAAGGTVWGLWLGFRHHGRAEPLAVGVFGLLWVAVGFATWPPVALMGTAIVLGAAIWGSLAYRHDAREDQ